MSQPESEDPGTGVKEVLDVLAKTPPERLRSLTYQLGQSPEENIVHALCLFILQREKEALDILEALKDNFLAKNVAKNWQRSSRRFLDFSVHCGHFQESESLITLARIFKILAEHGLCDLSVRNLAYKRALPRESTSSDLEYNQFREEAKDVCGPELAEILNTFTNLKLVSDCNNRSYMENTNATTSVAEDQSKSGLPSSLHTTSSMPSYPSHLEISVPPTASFYEANASLKAQEPSVASTASSPVSQHQRGNTSGPCIQPGEPQSHCIADPGFRFYDQNLHINIPYQPTEPATLISGDSLPEAAAKEEIEQDDVKFYSFVILHAQQDADVAESMKEKLENIIKNENGATYSEEFEEPGKYTLGCVEDAINNSAFTLLLLTTNFNSFLEMKTNAALVNSIQNIPKHNTVIPLLPKSNAMPKEDIPMVLKTLVPLEENKNFEKKIQKAMTPKRIDYQKKAWMKQRMVKSLRDRQERLKISNQQQQKVNEEQRSIHLLEQQRQSLLNESYNFQPAGRVGPDGRPWWPQQPNIHIANAQYIMIGNNSQMAVDHSKETEKKDT